MKKTPQNKEHRIQLKKDEIARYKECMKNYPSGRMEKCGIPFLNRLMKELKEIENERAN